MARLRLTGDGSGNIQSGSPPTEDLAFQLTDAQFSVIAVATPGKPSVVIDRIAYTPYGESTRTLRSDVNGDGVVNKDDYDGVIQPLKGTVIGDPGFIVEADLDRDGKITSDDYDVCIADDGQKSSGGVGEAGLFSAGVRNSVGYCGYIHNEDTGLYTVRYRTYSAVLGRWLTRDPAGYVDGMNLYAYVESRPLTQVDPLGLDGCDIKQDMYLRAKGVLPTRAEERAAREAERQARLARLRKNGISTTDDFIFWYYNGYGQPLHVSPSLEKEFREHELIKPVIEKIQNEAVQKAAESMPCNFDCKPGASWTVTLPEFKEPRSTVPYRSSTSCLGNPLRNTYSYGKGFIWASVSCHVTVEQCSTSGGKCKPTKVKVRCYAAFRADDKFEEPVGIPRSIGGDVFGDPYWFTTRWEDSFTGNPSCPPK